MNIQIIFFSCLCGSLAITVHYETSENVKLNPKEYKTALKDIRTVPADQEDAILMQKPPRSRLGNELKTYQKPREQKARRENEQVKSKVDRKRLTPSTARAGHVQTIQPDPNYMLKIANQLYMAQKHASLLSDYQKFILSQDQNVKNFVLTSAKQERNPKSLSRQRAVGRAIPAAPKVKYATSEPAAAANADYKKIVVVTPKVQTTAQIIPKPQNDHLAQATHIKYVTLAPQTLTHFAESHEPSQKVTLVPYYSPQQYTYYDLGVTHKPQVETIQIPTTISSHGLGAYETPKYRESEGGHHEDVRHHDDAKYEFMYNVKDHEKHNHFGHKESRSDKTTYGFYFVHLPDGRLETVKYWADKTGYHAKVDYQGEAKHPIHTDHKLHSHNLVHQ